jgi:DinB superfamily
MTAYLTIAETEHQLQQAATALYQFCASLSDDQFFRQPAGKWSPAQQVKHLITATNTARLAFVLPKFIVRLAGGTPNRSSRTYDELVARYTAKLQQGGRASGRYIPKPVPPSVGKEKLLNQFTTAMHQFATACKKNGTDPIPDSYLAPHPLLGKITLRELCYFTIYHTLHHLHNIKAISTPGGLTQN